MDDDEDARLDRADLTLRLFCLVIGLGMLGLCIHAGGIVWDGVSTGCVAARSGQRCHDAAPVRYAITLLLTTFATLLWLAGAVMALLCVRRWPR